MEILQTIWNALISENQKLSNILICPFIFIESYLYMMVFLTLLNIKNNKKQRVIYVVFFSVIAIINILFIPSPYYTFINVLACPLLVCLIFKLGILKSIFCEFTTYLVSFIIITPLILIYTSVTHLSSSLVNTIPLHRIIYSLLFYSLTFIFCKACIKFNIKLRFFNIDKIKVKLSLPLIINFIIGTIAISIQCYIEFTYIDYLPNYLVLLSSFVLVLYFIISMISLYRTSKLETTTQDLEAEKLYNQSLTILYDKIRGYKHDFNNIVQGLGGYISTNNMEGLKDYYNGILDDCQRTNNLALLSPDVINNPAIYSLLTAKYHVATEFGIKMNLEIFMDLTTIKMKIYELTRLLGILIDNAIEAAKQCSEKEITITFRNDANKKKQLFIIENTYTNKDVNIDNIFEKGHTSKTTEDAKNHGIGLWEVRQFIKKHKNLDLYTTKSEKYFKQQFEIYY